MLADERWRARLAYRRLGKLDRVAQQVEVAGDRVIDGLQHVAVLHLLDQVELDFDFDRPARFVDMEGNEQVLADPSLVAKQYREAVRAYFTELDEVVRNTAVDYHRVKLHENYDDVLARFLLGRTPKRGGR